MPFWKRKEKKGPWDEDPFRRMFEEFERMQEEMSRMFEEGFGEEEFMPNIEELLKKTKGRPMVYGFSFRIGPEGKPIVEEFGNIEPREREVRPEREPLVDVIHKEKEVTVLAELPGVEKEEVKLKVMPDKTHLEISAPDKFYKKVKLPAAVRPELGKASYKNGVLEVNLQKEKPSPPEKGTKIPIE